MRILALAVFGACLHRIACCNQDLHAHLPWHLHRVEGDCARAFDNCSWKTAPNRPPRQRQLHNQHQRPPLDRHCAQKPIAKVVEDCRIVQRQPQLRSLHRNQHHARNGVCEAGDGSNFAPILQRQLRLRIRQMRPRLQHLTQRQHLTLRVPHLNRHLGQRPFQRQFPPLLSKQILQASFQPWPILNHLLFYLPLLRRMCLHPPLRTFQAWEPMFLSQWRCPQLQRKRLFLQQIRPRFHL
mmetsp:Transcript_33791/g.50105  ORF Transcript_33791/g.50105 Transcript_33791/m.50105 type:complete len:239 (+) Transcript_33791:183-899(+)